MQRPTKWWTARSQSPRKPRTQEIQHHTPKPCPWSWSATIISYTRPSFSLKGVEITPIIGFAQLKCAIQGNRTCMLLTIPVYAHLHLEDGTEDENMKSVCYHLLTDYWTASSLLYRGMSAFQTNWSSSSLSSTVSPFNDYASQRISMPTDMCTPITSPSVALSSYKHSVSLSSQFSLRLYML